MNTLFLQDEEGRNSRILSIFYKLLHILFSLDFGFLEFKSYKTKIMYTFLSLFQCLVFTACLSYPFFVQGDTLNFLWNCGYILQYMLYVTFLKLHKPNITYYNYLCDLKSIDRNLGVDYRSYYFETKVLVANIISFAYETVSSIYYCIVYTDIVHTTSYVHLASYISMVNCMHFVCISNIFFYYAVLCRIKELRLILTSACSDLRSTLSIYKSIVDIVERYKPVFDYVYLTTLIFSVVQVMGIAYDTVYDLTKQNEMIISPKVVLHMTSLALVLAYTFAAALCAGSLTAQADQIRVLLLDRQMELQDETESRKLAQFIQYVEARGCRFRVVKVVPLDADLLGIVLDFCATYLIVIIQFTRLH